MGMEPGNFAPLLEAFLTPIADSGLESGLWTPMIKTTTTTTTTTSTTTTTTTTGENVESARSIDSNYRQRLRSYSSFPAGASTTSSDTTSPRADLMDVTYVEAQSLSDGTESDQRMRVRRTYECDVCRETFPSRQSLGGHKNVHRGKNKGRKSALNRASSCESSPEGVAARIFKGVRCREGTKWVSEIRPRKSSGKWWLSSFPSAVEAAQVYDVALCYFKSETDLNFDLHALCRTLPPIPPHLPRKEFALRLRKMVSDISKQIIADRPAQALASSRPTVSGDSSTAAEAQPCPTIPDLPTLDIFTWNELSKDEFDPLQFLSWPTL